MKGFVFASALAASNALTVDWQFDHERLGMHVHGDGTVALTLPTVSTSPWKGEDGAPALPVKRASYALASPSVPATLRVTNAVYEAVALPSGTMLAAAQHSFRCGQANASHVPLKMGAYAASVFNASATPAVLSAPSVLRDIAYQVLTVSPVQYDHAQRKLRVLTAATIEITGVAEVGMNSLPLRVVPAFAELYASSFENSAALNLDPTAKMTALLIHDDALSDEAATLKAHKENVQGVPTTLVPASQVGTTSRAFEKYIASQYGETKMAHLMLLGSIEVRPRASNASSAVLNPQPSLRPSPAPAPVHGSCPYLFALQTPSAVLAPLRVCAGDPLADRQVFEGLV